MPLAPALAPLAALPQFVVCSIEPKAEAGKTDKIPQSLRFGYPVPGNAQDAQNWLTADAAFAWVESHPTHPKPGSRYGVGFVLTAADPVWCLDIDNCLTPTGWSQQALALCAQFPGAAIEVSGSGRGLHVWGLGRAPAHSSRNAQLGAEMYSSMRFIALGPQQGVVGNVNLDWTTHLAAFVSTYFPAVGLSTTPAAADGDWTTEPVAEWRGPLDDDDLIRRAMRSNGGAASVGFGGSSRTATFAELFNCEVDALARAYPSSTGGAYDGSSADMALAMALAFWTGKNMERMERLMMRSALVRPKWTDRTEYYLHGTIRQACARKEKVCTDAEPMAREGPPSSPEGPRPERVDGATFYSPDQQLELFDGCVYVMNSNTVLVPGGTLLKPEVFTTMYGGRTYALDLANEKVTRKAFEAFTQSQANSCPKAFSTTFRPELPPGELITEGERVFVNTYWPIKVPREAGDIKPFFEHMEKLFPDATDRTIMLSYMAAVVQYPGVKFQWAPLVQGMPGNGKSTLSRCVAEAVGKRYTHWPKANKLGAQFNSWMTDKIFYAVEDIHVSTMTSESMFEDLKPMITGEDLEIEAKGVDQVSRNICGNFIFNSNHKGGIRKTDDDRRIAVFYTPQQNKGDLAKWGMTQAYFDRLRNWLTKEKGYAFVTDFLATWPIPAGFNPATDCTRCPDTTTTLEAIKHGQGQVEQEVDEAIGRGDQGFCGGWISSHFFDLLLAKHKKETSIPPNRRREILQKMGYDWHPGLNPATGRVDNLVRPDGTKPKLFVKPDHPSYGLRGADVARAYSAAQVGAGIAAPIASIPFGNGGVK